MNLLFTALIMLGGLGAAIFATTGTGKRDAAGLLALGFVLATIFIRPDALPDPRWLGCIVAGVAALEIFRPRLAWVALICGGALAGFWSALLQIQGLRPGAAMVLAGSVAGGSAILSFRRTEFAPEPLRQEAMLVMVGLGLAVAMIPEISGGWRSALALNREEGAQTNPVLSGWVLVLSASSVVLGGLYSLMRRR